MEVAIKHMSNKIGLSQDVGGSLYNNYNLSDENISLLSTFQLEYLTLDTFPKLNLKEQFQLVISDLRTIMPWRFEDVESILMELKNSTNHALGDPEDPNNAFLIFSVIEDSIPSLSSISIDSTTTVSPVQFILTLIWLGNEYNSEITYRRCGFKCIACKIGCYAIYLVELAACAYATKNQSFNECKNTAKSELAAHKLSCEH